MSRIDVLDHGYVELVEAWGSDQRIVESARMSTAKGFLGWKGSCPECTDHGMPDLDGIHCERCGAELMKTGDEKLLGYLYNSTPPHSSPFEFAGLVIEVQAPIFVFREWHRHRTQSYNEASARYAPLPDLNYVPTVERIELGGGHLTKQAGGIAEMKDEYLHETADRFRTALEMQYAEAESVYQAALASGVPKELARLVLPVGRYSKMRASANLRNWLGFLTLRMDPKAQWEIRQYADAVHEILSDLFPRTLGMFDRQQELDERA